MEDRPARPDHDRRHRHPADGPGSGAARGIVRALSRQDLGKRAMLVSQGRHPSPAHLALTAHEFGLDIDRRLSIFKSVDVCAARDRLLRAARRADLSDDEAGATAQLFKALADPARVKIVNLLATSEAPICACELIGAARARRSRRSATT